MRQKKAVNSLGFLSLLALLGFLGWLTGEKGYFGFFGFAYYIRYFFVLPDELFQLSVRRAATLGFFTQVILLVPLSYGGYWMLGEDNVLRLALGLSFAAGIIVFSIDLTVMELRESAALHD